MSRFWSEFENEWTVKKTSDFSCFVFPQFGANSAFLRDKTASKLRANKVNLHLDFSNTRFLGQVNFSNAIFTQDVDFSVAIFEKGASFHKATFEQKANFKDATFTQNANFSHVNFALDANFNEATFKNEANFSDATFDKNAEFCEAIIEGYFVGGLFKEVADFNGMGYSDKTKFVSVQFDGPASFLGLKYGPSLRFSNIKVKDRFDFGYRQPPKGDVDESNFVPPILFLEGIAFVDCVFHKEAKVYIGNLNIGSLFIGRLVNFSSAVKLANIGVTKKLSISESNLGGVEFSNVYLKSANSINITNSSVIKVLFNDVIWGKVNRERIMANRDTFRQLKAANEEQKNYIQANEFYGMEMEAYRDSIKDNEWWEQERIVFWLGKEISDFSNNWVLPIKIYFLLTVAFYSLSLIVTNYSVGFRRGMCHFLPQVFLDPLAFISLSCVIESFLKFMNPLETKYDSHGSPVLMGIWIVYKVFAGLVIYQIIVSLRRKTRH